MAASALRSLVAGLAVALVVAACGDDDPVASPSTTVAATGSTECTPSPSDTTRVPVVVVEEEIAAGTTAADAIASGALVVREISDHFRPATAATSLDQLTGGIAIDHMAANQVVTFPHFGLPVDGGLPEATNDPGCPT